jgi:ribosomal protein S4
MRFINKYKSYDKLFSIFEKFPLRIAKFKSTKWKKIQRLLLFKSLKKKKYPTTFTKAVSLKKKVKFSRRKLFFNNLLVKVSLKTWYRVEKYYENGRRIKNILNSMFDKSVLTKHFRKILKFSKKASEIQNAYSYTLLKPEFRLDILLWRLNFFSSSYQAFQAIAERKIIVNGRIVQGNFFLSKGDVVSFRSNFKLNTLNVKKVKYKTLFSKIISTFVEIDYYSNCIVVLKDVKDLGKEDLYILVKDSYSLKKVKDYI